MPSADVAAEVAYFTDVLRGELLFAIEAMGTRVAMVRPTPGGGPCCAFTAPGGHRIAAYELTRPQVRARFAGRRDF
jgi:hypothetical protein